MKLTWKKHSLRSFVRFSYFFLKFFEIENQLSCGTSTKEAGKKAFISECFKIVMFISIGREIMWKRSHFNFVYVCVLREMIEFFSWNESFNYIVKK